MLDVIQVHPGDGLARNAIVHVLNRHHSRRISQANLDFYRHEYKKFMAMKKDGGEILFLIALKNCYPIGISCCTISRRTGNASRSITIVDTRYRKIGLGKMLLAAKIALLSWQYTGVALNTFVSKENVAAIKMCEANKMFLLSESVKERGDSVITICKYGTVKINDPTSEDD